MNLLPWLLAPLTLFLWLVIEKYIFTKQFFISNKDSSIIKLEILGIALRLLLSFILFFPLLSFFVQFNIWSFSDWDIHPILNFFICFMLIDFFHYLVHRVHHSSPILWKFHRLHHSDKDVDVMTSWLHHPLEVLSTYLMITFLYVVFDIPLDVIYAYSIIFILHVAFTHTKITVPHHIDKWLRYLVVTPNVHRLHHSKDMKEGNSNFGQIFLIWDIFFRTHINKSSKEMIFGIQPSESPQNQDLWSYLINPFNKEAK